MSVTNCNEFERALRRAVERREPFEFGEFRAHASVCTNCRSEWERHTVLERAIPAWKTHAVEVDLADTVLSKLAFDDSPAGGDLDRATSRESATDSLVSRQSSANNGRHRESRRGVRVVIVAAVAMLALLPLLGLPTNEQSRSSVDLGRTDTVAVVSDVVARESSDPVKPDEPTPLLQDGLLDRMLSADAFGEQTLPGLADRLGKQLFHEIPGSLDRSVDRLLDAVRLETPPAT